MHDKWEDGIQYNHGCVVRACDNHCYRIIQPHRSQSDWTPERVPALWEKLPRHECQDAGDCSKPHQQEHQQGYQQEHHQGYPQQHQQHHEQTPQQQPPQYSDEKKPEQEPEHKHWYEDDGTKKKLGIGAGLVGGAALLAGGVFAYKKHEEHKEEEKAETWARGKWIEEARARTEEYNRRGRSDGEPIWILTRGKSIPQGALVTGHERGQNLYSSRAFHEGALVIGKASERFQKGSLIGYGNDEIDVEEFEVLVGDIRNLCWVSVRDRLKVDNLRRRPVEGGREKDGTPVYVVHAPHKDAEHPGKTSEKLDGAYITYGGKEKVIEEYEILCHK